MSLMSRGRVWLRDIGPWNVDYSIGNDNTHVDKCPYYVRPPIGTPNAIGLYRLLEHRLDFYQLLVRRLTPKSAILLL
jgi:hypothetical protein